MKGNVVMKIEEMINTIQVPQTDYILIDYDLFFNDNIGKYNKFAVDDLKDIQNLKNVLYKIQCKDINARLYVCSYSYETVDCNGNKSIYADCIWINTNMDIGFINKVFDEYKTICPSEIISLRETDDFSQEHIYLLKSDGMVLDIKKHNFNLNDVVTLYWD